MDPRLLGCEERGKDLEHVVDLRLTDTRKAANEEAVVHDRIGVDELRVNAACDVLIRRLSQQVTAKDVTRLDLVCFQVLSQLGAREARPRTNRNWKTEPRRVAAR